MNRPGSKLRGEVEITTAHVNFGRPVISAVQRNATLRGGVSALAEDFLAGWKISTPQLLKAHLPAGPLPCTIRLAYQAADASHPKG
jgi:hypothetical protein